MTVFSICPNHEKCHFNVDCYHYSPHIYDRSQGCNERDHDDEIKCPKCVPFGIDEFISEEEMEII